MRSYLGTILFLAVIFSVSVTIFAEKKLMPVPTPQLDHLEEAVSRQLRDGRKMVDAVTGKQDVSPGKRARAYGELGQLYHAYGLTEAAEACYHNALVLDPSHFQWNYSSAYLLQSVGKYSEALERYIQAKSIQKNTGMLYLVNIRIGECYRSLNQPQQAKSAFEEAYKLKPEGPAVLARLGESALDQKEYDKAVKYLEGALAGQPDANKLHYSLAMAYRGTGDTNRARIHLSKRGMVGIQPPDPLRIRLEELVEGYRVHLLAGRLAFSAGRYGEAAQSFKKSIEADPKEVAARINLGATLWKLKEFRQALAHFKVAVELAPDNVTAHFNLGMLYGYFDNYRKVIEHLTVVIKGKPKDSWAHLLLADALNNEQQIWEAFKHYKTAVELNPSLISGWLSLSTLYSSVNRHAEALQTLEDAHAHLPNEGLIVHALARQLAASPIWEKRQGKRALDLAIKVFKAAKNYDHARTVAMAYAQLKQCDKAVEWMERAIKLAEESTQGRMVMEILKRNLAHFKTTRPCHVPAAQGTSL